MRKVNKFCSPEKESTWEKTLYGVEGSMMVTATVQAACSVQYDS